MFHYTGGGMKLEVDKKILFILKLHRFAMIQRKLIVVSADVGFWQK
jgi:hypothetical protein